MEKLDFNAPRLPLYLTATAPTEAERTLRAAMGAQLTTPVRWAELILNVKAAGVDTWVEVGPKNVSPAWCARSCPRSPPGISLTWRTVRVSRSF